MVVNSPMACKQRFALAEAVKLMLEDTKTSSAAIEVMNVDDFILNEADPETDDNEAKVSEEIEGDADMHPTSIPPEALLISSGLPSSTQNLQSHM